MTTAGIMACLYAIWLLAGTLDFHFHRRTDIGHTSGLRESALHGVQLALIGAGVLAWLSLAPSRGLAVMLFALVALHAVVGYLDTASADGRRRISPAEQHVHSILDIAPWVFLLWIAVQADSTWSLQKQLAQAWHWWAILVPAALIVVIPWLYELRRCLAAAGARV
ncbi:hypothetical protein [Stenotrophomonas sp.]|uniref:hypothetical protein n=1 Tax=Stenotrophomonas sp. TaxID=69392 RepID=UPI0028A8154D|nr:hypothetical protein [Stenotrophomonas sp.]